MDKIKIGILVGSLRRASYSRAVADALVRTLPDWMEAEILDISGLEMYNQDFDDEGNLPASWVDFRGRVRGKDAVIFVTPEYNRSIPGVLKNAIDIGSRPPAQNAWGGKPAAVISISTGRIGGFGANHHLRQSLACLNLAIMPSPDFYLSEIRTMLDEGGAFTADRAARTLKTFWAAFTDWVSKLTQSPLPPA